ncbi:UDP-N-acetylmuramate--L-alanine ligase [Bifidobacterium jacchi]|uniref:UDP-N-acetylmuramate--L-alanine ligase n=1 Tax=Bifidobacterium jacchi TaxID=2490545 RepID=A0A5N5RFF2_9BIFI|nr:Mur ligase domain-containing protein [Bifidobacterium jacchi]KAB5605979.1 UDP-N-acetylmuramate--L-alanine ligase [Bifidobacterium jacchi]
MNEATDDIDDIKDGAARALRQPRITLDPPCAAFGANETIADLGSTHFIGIGGAGMSVLAEMLHERGVAVDGSDRESSAKTERLESMGIRVEIGQNASNVAEADTVVYSSAIKPDNPEIIAAAERGARIVHRSDILALLMHGRRAVTVAGTHGKTTTSSLLAHILTHAGTGALADPSYAIGGTIQGPDGTTLDGGHAGTGDVLVAEADESDGSFEKYHPTIAIITNAESDHLDHYGTTERYREAFVEHARHAAGADATHGGEAGHVVLCGDDEGALEVLRRVDETTARRTIIYSTHDETRIGDLRGAAFVRIESERESAGSGVESFRIILPAAVVGAAAGAGAEAGDAVGDAAVAGAGSGTDADRNPRDVTVPVHLIVPGLHNARNATAAIIAATLLGMQPADAARAAGTFLGASRRFQIRGTVDGVTVVDDYAHHPTEIAALLDAARRRYPNATLHVLFQPHLFSRTRFFAHEFAEALAKADDVIVTGIFPARERQADFPDVGPGTVVDAAGAAAGSAGSGDPGGAGDAVDSAGSTGVPNRRADWIEAVDDMRTAAQMLALRARPGDVIFTVGAGDVTTMVPVLLHALQARAGQVGRDAGHAGAVADGIASDGAASDATAADGRG